jgi:proliferating cell nuclear antigen
VVLRQGSGKKNEGVVLDVEEPVNLSFACRYLNLFSKVSSIAGVVVLNMSQETPLMVEYGLPSNLGYLRFYLAPKIS